MKPADASAFQNLIATATLPDIGPVARSDVQTVSDLMRALDGFVKVRQIAAPTESALRAAALLWHDHLDESHRISQNLPDANGSFLHGIMHRREPDFSNAKYWFRQVGPHRAFPKIAQRVAELLKRQPAAKSEMRLLLRGAWNAMGFVDACEEAATSAATERQLLQQIQAIEFEELVQEL